MDYTFASRPYKVLNQEECLIIVIDNHLRHLHVVGYAIEKDHRHTRLFETFKLI